MGLAEHEKRELDAIEQHLAEDDPALATKLSKPSWHLRLSGTALFVVGLLATYATGLTLLAAGVTLSSWPLIAAGAAVTGVYPMKVALRAAREHRRSS